MTNCASRESSLATTTDQFRQMTGFQMTEFTEDDLLSLEDMPLKPSSALSVYSADYGFSEDDGKSFSNHASLYVDADDEKLKAKKQQKQPSGTLEALLSPAPRKMKTGKRSSNLDALLSPTGRKKLVNRSSNLEALLSLSPSENKKTANNKKNKSSDSSELEGKMSDKKRVSSQLSSGSTIQNMPKSKPKTMSREVDDDEYETHTSEEGEYDTDTGDEHDFADDDDDLELVSERSKGAAGPKPDLVERALSMNRDSMRRSLSRKRDAMSLSDHRKGRKEEVALQSPKSPRKRSLSKNRTLDTLSLSIHTKDKTETRRPRKGSTRQSFLQGSASNLDHTPKRSASLKSFSIVRGLEGSAPNLDYTPKRSSSTRSSSAPKIKRKSVDRSNHSTSGDDDMSNRSAPVRRKKTSLDSVDYGFETLSYVPKRKSSQSIPKRSSSTCTKRKKKGVMDQSNHSMTSENSSSFAMRETSQSIPTRSLSTVTRRNKKDLMDQSNHSLTSENGSQLISRISLSTRKKKDCMGQSNHSVESRRRNSSNSKPSDPQVDSALLSPGSTKQTRKTKRASDDEDEEKVQPDSFQSLSSGSDDGKRKSMRSKITSGLQNPKLPFRATSLKVRGEDMAAVSRKLRNMTLSSSSDHRGPKQSSKPGQE